MDHTSDHFNGKIFLNPVPTTMMQKGAYGRMIKMMFQKHPGRSPVKALGPFVVNKSELNRLLPDELRVTWLGHSTVIIDIDGKRFLTDPLWYSRASPFTWLGPRRYFANPVAIDGLPPIDAILLSHDHYDHLDKNSIIQLTSKKIPVITMLGVGQLLMKWGIDKTLITEIDWWQSVKIDDHFTITATPARHFSGRWIGDRFRTLWGSFAIKGPQHNVYYGADSGYYDGFKTIGDKLGPFDVTMLEIGAYNDEWAFIHMGPEGAVQAHLDLKGKLLMPVHWGLFSLAFHPWKEPVERLLKAAAEKNVSLLLPAPGMTVNIGNGAFNSRWWEQYV